MSQEGLLPLCGGGVRLIPHRQEAPTLVIGFVRGRFARTISNRITPHSEPCGVESLRVRDKVALSVKADLPYSMKR